MYSWELTVYVWHHLSLETVVAACNSYIPPWIVIVLQIGVGGVALDTNV